jgi:hypothetical protein
MISGIVNFCNKRFLAKSDKSSSAIEMHEPKLSKAKVAQIYSKIIVDQVEYDKTKLTSCGTSKGEKIRPFLNYGKTNPHTYRSNLVEGDGEAAYHDELAARIISKYLEPTTSANWGATLQNSLQDGHPKQVLALRVAAMLIQIGDGLNPLPHDLNIQFDIIKLGCQVTYDSKQKGMILFDDIGNITVIGESLNATYEDLCAADDEDRVIPGELIMQFEGQRTITIGMPDHEGNVICTIARKYFFN